MPSGRQRIVHNTLERLLSTDFNREQAFLSCAGQQAWRARYNEQRANWRLNPGLGAQAQTDAAPAYGEVYSGLMVRPDNPGFLLVDPGVAMILAPGLATSSDDSPYYFADDPGVPASFFTFTANVTVSSVRWDVFECKPVDQLLETSSRDIYNPATGLFSPVAVDKVRAGRLQYRLRLGTAGAGFPGAASGWLPLAVVAVRNGATGFDKCDVYDVRPLVSERVLPQPPGLSGSDGTAVLREAHYQSTFGTFVGFAEAEFGGYLAGGALRRSTIASTLASFGNTDNASGGDGGDCHALDSFSPGNQGGGWTVPTCAPLYVACLFPFTPGQPPLPRWARYSEGPDPIVGRRVPNGPRGILCFTATPPGDNGLFAPISFPADQQLGVSGVGPAIAFGSASAGGRVDANFAGRRYAHVVEHTEFLDVTQWSLNSVTSASGAVWTLTPGVHYPPNAKALVCSVALLVDYSGGGFNFLNVSSQQDGLDTLLFSVPTGHINDQPQTNAKFFLGPFRLERPTLRAPLGSDTLGVSPYPVLANPPGVWKIAVAKPGAYVGLTTLFHAGNCFLYIHGWEV